MSTRGADDWGKKDQNRKYGFGLGRPVVVVLGMGDLWTPQSFLLVPFLLGPAAVAITHQGPLVDAS